MICYHHQVIVLSIGLCFWNVWYLKQYKNTPKFLRNSFVGILLYFLFLLRNAYQKTFKFFLVSKSWLNFQLTSASWSISSCVIVWTSVCSRFLVHNHLESMKIMSIYLVWWQNSPHCLASEILKILDFFTASDNAYLSLRHISRLPFSEVLVKQNHRQAMPLWSWQ